MKLLVISAAFPPMRAGEADHVFHLCRHLAEAGVAVEVLTRRRDVLSTRLPFRVVPLMRTWSWLALPRLAMHVRRAAPDAVLLVYSDWIYGWHPMIAFVPAVLRRLRPGTAFVTQLETESVSLRASLATRAVLKTMAWVRGEASSRQYVIRALVGGSDRVIVLSEHHRRRVVERLPAMTDRVLTIPPPPLVAVTAPGCRAEARARLGARSDEFLLVYFGFVDPTKGVETLFAALRLVVGRRSGVRLLMVGGGGHGATLDPRAGAIARHEQAMRRMPDDLGIGRHVTWTGGYASDSAEPSVCLRAADACVLPYDQGIMLHRSSFAAAAAHGLPIVTTRGAVVESAFRDRQNVLLCRPKNPEALSAALEEVIDNPELRATLREGALALAREWFCWDTAVARTLAALRRDGRPATTGVRA